MALQLDLSGKVAVVTGGTTGIGRAVALAFARAGADVAVCSRGVSPPWEDEDGPGLGEQLAATGRRYLILKADVTREEDVKAMVETVCRELGGIDILINNAGWRVPNAALDITREEWNRTLETCLTGAFLCSQAVAPVMKQRGGGAIVNVSSIAGLYGRANAAHYGAAKAGMINLTRSLALEWAPLGIRVNCVAPGTIVTQGFLKLRGLQRPEDFVPANALKRAGTVDEVTRAVVFLASDWASYITGEVLEVSGGAHALG